MFIPFILMSQFAALDPHTSISLKTLRCKLPLSLEVRFDTHLSDLRARLHLATTTQTFYVVSTTFKM